MYKQKIKAYFDRLVEISDNDFDLFTSKLVKISYPKNSIIIERGKIENYLSFIQEGVVRFNIPGVDHDLTFDFGFADSFVSAYDSFITQSPSSYNIEAMSNCTLWCISKNDLEIIYAQTDIGDRIGRIIAENIYLNKMKREISLLQNSAKQRYLDLLQEKPQLVQNIPLKYLASYIGIKPQSLSRLRKTIY